jgi:hypothetical protein
VITPLQIHAMLHRRAAGFPSQSIDIDELWNSATLAWLAAQLLRRYADQNPRATEPSYVARLEHALHTVEREMQWLRFCGGDAQVHDLVCAVAIAVACVEQAATLLGADVSDDVSPRWPRAASPAASAGVGA